LSRFWEDCCGTNITRSGNILTLPNSSWEKGGGPMKQLYIRSCYTAIVAGIEDGSKTHVLVRGTPAIGKSAFLFYLIYLKAQELGNISFCLTYLIGGAPVKWYLIRENDNISITRTMSGLPDYYFSDSVDIGGPTTARKLTMLFASIDEKHFKEFCKVKSI
jgi:hypothetical protein